MSHLKSGKLPEVALLSILLENRKLGFAMLGGGLLYFITSIFGFSIMPCPIREVSGLLCPGCGLTSGCKALVRGDWHLAFHYNWFSPVFALFWFLVGVGLFLPDPHRTTFINLVKVTERRTYWPIFLGVSLVAYGLTRNIISA